MSAYCARFTRLPSLISQSNQHTQRKFAARSPGVFDPYGTPPSSPNRSFDPIPRGSGRMTAPARSYRRHRNSVVYRHDQNDGRSILKSEQVAKPSR